MIPRFSTARAFGPAVIEGFTDYHWIYCEWSRMSAIFDFWRLTVRIGLGPTLGALLATAFYVFLKHVHYWYVTVFLTSSRTTSPLDHPGTE